MDSLFPKMLAEIETNVDIVFVIDVTKSMEVNGRIRVPFYSLQVMP